MPRPVAIIPVHAHSNGHKVITFVVSMIGMILMQRGFRASLAFLLLMTSGIGQQALAQSEKSTVVPHQAAYTLALTNIQMGGATQSEPGNFVVRLQRRCTDWVLLTQLTLVLDMPDGQRLEVTSISSSEESLDGSTLKFESSLTFNGNLAQASKGTAFRQGDGEGRVQMELPEPLEGSLPRGALFPVSAFDYSIEQVRNGQKFIEYILFDGSSEKPLKGTDVVLGPAAPFEDPVKGDVGLLEGQSWRIVTSFFDMDVTDAPPSSTNISDVLGNGISTRLALDVGLAEAEGLLTSITKLEEPDC